MESCAGLAALGDGWDSGACISVFPGEPEGVGVIPGIGICISCWPVVVCGLPAGAADGVADGITMPGVCSWPAGAGDAVADGITMPGVCLWPAGIGTGLAFGLRVDAFRLVFRFGFRLGVVFGFGLLIPGILWPSCWAATRGVELNESTDAINAANKKVTLYD